MPVAPIPLANEFVDRYGGGNSIDHLKLQKLLYFTQGWWLALNGGQLVSERPQVWRYGPVFRWVYNAFNRYGDRAINAPTSGNPLAGGQPVRLSPQERAAVGPMIDWIWGEYGARSGVDLSNETHAIGTPWQRIAAAHRYSVPLGTEIPARDDWEYFSQLAIQRGWNPAPFAG